MNAASAPVAFGPSRTVRLGIRRIGFELRQYFRASDQVFFTFLFPTLMYLIFATIFTGDVGEGADKISMATYYLPGLVAGGIFLSGMQGLSIEIAVEKSDGTLKRLGSTPISPVTYFIGKIGEVFVTAILQIALLLIVAVVLYGVELPSDADAWGRFAWVFVLGLLTCTMLGIALSALPRSGKTASAVVIPVVLLLQFISGVYIAFSSLPEWLQNVASAFPLKWIAQGMRAAILPDSFGAAEPNGGWELGLVAIALAAWLVAGIILSRATFRWIRRD
ncbi:ABC transporter permease [Microbacterium phyllosphaerae]|uniref:ABC transporter permease n=1 Tax=Microbacterium phyllosphaerae TaxID=124798 RepID=UPI002169B95F|nr:ABC transporter permease [Microbacterium phyllosphaerae]MCS3442518.1 ABC-2 type transport system permease protein [Microbacterium phyllosphaerae]